MKLFILLAGLALCTPVALADYAINPAPSFGTVPYSYGCLNSTNVETSTDIEGDLCPVGDGSGEYEACATKEKREAEAAKAANAAAEEAKDKAKCAAKKCLVVRQTPTSAAWVVVYTADSWKPVAAGWRCECLKEPRAEKKGKR